MLSLKGGTHNTLNLTNVSREATAQQYWEALRPTLHTKVPFITSGFFLQHETFPDSPLSFLQGGVKWTLATLALINIYSCVVQFFSSQLHYHRGLLPGNPRVQWVLPHQILTRAVVPSAPSSHVPRSPLAGLICTISPECTNGTLSVATSFSFPPVP